jgi:hypothetical protein
MKGQYFAHVDPERHSEMMAVLDDDVSPMEAWINQQEEFDTIEDSQEESVKQQKNPEDTNLQKEDVESPKKVTPEKKESDLKQEKTKEQPTPEQKEPKEKSKIFEDIVKLNLIKKSAEKSLEWMKGKNSAFSTESMIHREESKIKLANKQLKEMKAQLGSEDKKTAEQLGLIAAINESLGENKKEENKKTKRAFGGFFKKHRKKIALAGLIGLTALLLKSDISFGKRAEVQPLDLKAKGIERVDVEMPSPEIQEVNIGKESNNLEGVTFFAEEPISSGYSQALRNAFENNHAIADKLGVPQNNDPQFYEQLMKDMGIISQKEFELRFGNTGKIQFGLDRDNQLVARVFADPSNPEKVSVIRTQKDTLGEVKKIDQEYVSTKDGKTAKYTDFLNN